MIAIVVRTFRRHSALESAIVGAAALLIAILIAWVFLAAPKDCDTKEPDLDDDPLALVIGATSDSGLGDDPHVGSTGALNETGLDDDPSAGLGSAMKESGLQVDDDPLDGTPDDDDDPPVDSGGVMTEADLGDSAPPRALRSTPGLHYTGRSFKSQSSCTDGERMESGTDVLALGNKNDIPLKEVAGSGSTSNLHGNELPVRTSSSWPKRRRVMGTVTPALENGEYGQDQK